MSREITPVEDYLEQISTTLPEETYGRLLDAIFETECGFGKQTEQSRAENAKLRELVKDMYHDLSHETFPPDWIVEYENDLRELGIEVD